LADRKAKKSSRTGGTLETYIPEPGDFIFLDFQPQAGHEQAGRRPALVISPRIFNERTGFAIVCPVTNTIRGWPFEAPVSGKATISGVVLADQVRSLDWRARNARFHSKAPRDTFTRTLGLVKSIIDTTASDAARQTGTEAS
jgi:mRNA interferase MazF